MLMYKGKNIVVYDLETKHTFDEVGGGRDAVEKLGISVLGAYDYVTDEFLMFEEKELDQFEKRLQDKPLLVGFNNKKFDTPVLQPYMRFDLKVIPEFDILEELAKILGHRVSLDSVASATLGKTKIGHGLDAIRYYRNGEMDKLKKYCLEDVNITKQVYEYGAEKSELFYTPKFGTGKSRVEVIWTIAHPEEGSEASLQQSLF